MFLRGAVCVPPEASAVGPPIRTQRCLSRPPSPFPEPGPRFLGECHRALDLGETQDVPPLGSSYKGLNLTSQPQL